MEINNPTTILPGIITMVSEYSDSSLDVLNENEKQPVIYYFNDLVTRLMRDESIDEVMLIKLANKYGVSETRVPEIANYLSNWGRD
ncbi:DUF2543 family protein [Enterobacter hormaechei]|uniref:DUF2543 family protein n=1 Tax=Enterobacter hormaechei TaxID=158836 RepID=UPI002FF03D9E